MGRKDKKATEQAQEDLSIQSEQVQEEFGQRRSKRLRLMAQTTAAPVVRSKPRKTAKAKPEEKKEETEVEKEETPAENGDGKAEEQAAPAEEAEEAEDDKAEEEDQTAE